MSNKRKNFHYHYAEQYETRRPGSSRRRRGRWLPVPPLAFFVCLVVLLMFGFVTTSFSVFVTTSLNDPAMPASGGLIVKVRNELVRAADGGSGVISRKNDAELADTGAAFDYADTGAVTKFTSGTYVYCNPNGKWSASSAKIGAYFYNSSTDYAWSTNMYTCGSIALRFLVPGTNKTWSTVIFVRLNSDTTTPSWDKKWNQTGNLSYNSAKNCFDVSDCNGDNCAGTWNKNMDDEKSVSLTANSSTLNLCGSPSTTLSPSFTSTYYTNSSVTYAVNKTGATVDNSTGVFTATKSDTYTVTATFSFYANGFADATGTTTATTTITVNTCSITSSPTSLSNMKIGDTKEVTFTGNASYHSASQEISVASSDASKVSVATKTAYSSGTKAITVTLTALKPGSNIKITATCAGSGVTKQLLVTVTAPTLTASGISLHEGESGTLSVSSSGTNENVTPTYAWAKVTAGDPITLANVAGHNEQQTVTAGTYSVASSTVRITASYVVGSSTYTTTKDVTVSLSELDYSIDDVSLYEGQIETITPDNNTTYTNITYSWSEDSGGTLLDVTGLDLTASTFSAKAKAYNSSDHSIEVSLTATFAELNNFQKTVTCTVTVNQITMTSLSMTKTEGDRGTFAAAFNAGAPTPGAYGANPAYSWFTTDTTKITLSNAQTNTVTVKTESLGTTGTVSGTTAHVSLTVYYDTGFSKTFSNIGTITINKSPYYLLGLGPSASPNTNWNTNNESRRMVYNPDSSKYEVKITLTQKTYEKGTEDGFKLYVSGENKWYSNSGTLDNITRSTQHNNLTFVENSTRDNNTGIVADVAGDYTFTLAISGSTKTIQVEYPMDKVKIYSNIVGNTTAMCEISGVTYGSNLPASTVTSNADFITARTALENAGYKFTNTWESSDPNIDDPLVNITDPTKKIYAVFVPESPDITLALLPSDRVTVGTDGSALHPYEVPYGSSVKVSASLDLTGVTPAQAITYTWYTYDGTGYTDLSPTGTTYTSAVDTLIETIPSGSKEFILCVRASCTDALGTARTDDYVSKQVYYTVKSAVSDMEKTLGGTVVDQKIYSTAPDLKLKIYADLFLFGKALDSTDPADIDTTKQDALFAKTIELLRYNGGGYTETLSDGGEITGDSAIPNYASSVTAQDGGSDTIYGSKRGVNYLEFRMNDDGDYEDGFVYDFRTVVGTNSDYPTRPLYFENNSGTSLSNYRLMIFYYDSDAGSLVYQTAQTVDGSNNGNLYRFEIPKYKTGAEDNSWDGNVWIAAFKKSSSDKYALPVYDNSAATADAKLSFTGVSSILYAKTAVTSVTGKQKLTVASGGISGSVITVS